MLRIADKNGYILYYDTKYNDFLVVTVNYKITRYWKRLPNTVAIHFEKQIENYRR